LVPLIFACIVRRNWAWFIAYFCLIANGCYLAIAWYTGEALLDTAKLLREGTPPYTIAIYCLATIPTGYAGFRKACRQQMRRKIKSA
jgi:hypothetical protein